MSPFNAFPEFGNFNDNATAFSEALHAFEQGEMQRGLHILHGLDQHIQLTGDLKSLVHLLPRVKATLSRYQDDENDRVKMLNVQHKKVLGVVASENRRIAHSGPTLAALVANYPTAFQNSFVICDRGTYRDVFRRLYEGTTDIAPKCLVLRSADQGGLSEMAGLLSDGSLDTVMFLTDATDLETSDARTLVRAAIRDNAEIYMTFRSISDRLDYEGSQSISRKRPSLEDEGIAIVAHPDRKLECMHWLVANAGRIAKFRRVFATGMTGAWVKRFLEAVGFPSDRVVCVKSGQDGGDEQLSRKVMANQCHHVVFFVDAQWAPPHEAAIFSLLRACTARDLTVNLLLNERSANSWIQTQPVAA